MSLLKSILESNDVEDAPFDGAHEAPKTHKDRFGNTIKKKNMAKHLAKKGMADAKKPVKEGYRNIMTTHEGEKFKSKLHATKKDADDHHWKMTKATDKHGKKIYKKIDTIKEEVELEEIKSLSFVEFLAK